ncbi:MAG: hypothetical protein JRC86_11995 [Deltaproteobacteria bacterium]|nr:hypothetical protein [Deltaproteobacteria bacterium]
MEEESRKNNKKEEIPAVGWEIVYTSLVLILVALFAMLVSYSTIEGDRITSFMRGYNTMATTTDAGKIHDTAADSLFMEGGTDAIEGIQGHFRKQYTFSVRSG